MSYWIKIHHTEIELPDLLDKNKSFCHKNNPINLDLCYSYEKDEFQKNYPCITFHFMNYTQDWIFDLIEERDAVYETIRSSVSTPGRFLDSIRSGGKII